MQLTRCDWNGTSCVELQWMGLQLWQASAKEWPLWCAPSCKRVEVRLSKCTVSSTKKPYVPRQSNPWRCDEHCCENCQHNSSMRALPQTILSFPIWCRCWIRGPTLPFSCALAKSRLRAAAVLFPEIRNRPVFDLRPLHELSDPLWLADLAFLVDLTEHLNTLNKTYKAKTSLYHNCMRTWKHCVWSSVSLRHNYATSILCTSPRCSKSN